MKQSSPDEQLIGKKQDRNYALDLLRIQCMFFVVLLHAMCYGGVLNDTVKQGLDAPGVVLWCMYAVTYTAVSAYVLISGYFQVNQKFRLSRIIKIVFQVWFYSWIITAVCTGCGFDKPISMKTIQAMLPISFDQYWFVTAYIGLCLLSPILNFLIHRMNKKQHLGTILVLVFMQRVWRDVIPVSESPFFDNANYSLSLFVELYLIAAYIRLYVDPASVRHPVRMLLLGCSFMAATFFIYMILDSYVDMPEFIPVDYYYRNHSIPVLIASLGMFLAFLKLKICNSFVIKLVRVISPLTFGVYLIHEHNILRMPLWNRLIVNAAFPRDMVLPIRLIGISLIVFATCLVIEYIRARLFFQMERTNWYQKCMQKIDDSVYVLYDMLTEKIGGNSK